MPSLWFVVPVHGRLPLAAICLRQLRRTCNTLVEHGIEATAVVVSDRDNLAALARLVGQPKMLGFGWVKRDNQFLSRKFNDGIQMACDPNINPRPADYVVPCGSDDWVHPDLFLNLPDRHSLVGFKNLSFVREDGRELTTRFLNYPGGSGIRVYPANLMRRAGYRPADEDRKRACDTSILVNTANATPRLRLIHGDSDPRQIVDWKTPGEQLNSYDDVKIHRAGNTGDPFVELSGWFPEQSLAEMEAHYATSKRRPLVFA